MTLEIALERPVPESIPAHSPTALFLVGSCWHPETEITGLDFVVDGRTHRASAHAVPRPDVAAAHPDHAHASYFSGFWATLPLPALDGPGPIEVGLVATLRSGGREHARLGEIAVSAAPSAPVSDPPPAPGTIAICMATFEPEEALFRAQIESLRAQTDENWICLISDDDSAPESFEKIVEIVGPDPRFHISRAPVRHLPYRNFERALELVPEGVELIALCDQDDRWYPEKLEALRAGLADALLVYSDLRLVETDGRVLRETMWRGRSNNYDDLASMLVANTVTGASALFRREVLDLAVPFPDTPGYQFHDHWLAVVALAAGRLAYVDRPLYDYVQHAGAVFGHVTHGERPNLRERISAVRTLRGIPRWRAGYFYGYLSREAQAQAALLRCGDRLSAPKRRALERFIACDTSTPALLWLLARGLRTYGGRDETLGTEIEIAQGIVWKRLIVLRSRLWRRQGGRLADASIPPPENFVQKRLRRWRARV